MATGTAPCQQLPTDQQVALGFVDGSSRVNGQHSVWTSTTLIEEGKHGSAQWTELQALRPCVWDFTAFWVSDQWPLLLSIDHWELPMRPLVQAGRQKAV